MQPAIVSLITSHTNVKHQETGAARHSVFDRWSHLSQVWSVPEWKGPYKKSQAHWTSYGTVAGNPLEGGASVAQYILMKCQAQVGRKYISHKGLEPIVLSPRYIQII